MDGVVTTNLIETTQSDQQKEIQAQVEHLRLIFDHAVFVLVGNIAASATLMVGAWGVIDPALLLTWFAVLATFNVFRWVGSRRFPAGAVSQQELVLWERRFLLTTFISGALWGIAGGVFFVTGDPGYYFFLSVVIIAMAAAATTSHSYHRLAYLTYFVPAVTPLIVNLIIEPAIPARALGLITPFYFALMYVLSRRIYAAAHSSIISRLNHEQMALLDHLTGIANRRAFQQEFQREWLRAERAQRPLSLLIADIDNFKHYNDAYGHAAGDQVLKAVAAMAAQRMRQGTDLVARIGGEEFAVILPDTDITGALLVAEDIRNRINALRFEMDGHQLTLTLSLGVATEVPAAVTPPERLFKRADAALYKAKQLGKDRVCS